MPSSLSVVFFFNPSDMNFTPSESISFDSNEKKELKKEKIEK